MSKDFTNYDMKNKFQFPVYVAFNLDTIKDELRYINREKAIPGILKYEKGTATLQIDDRPKKNKNDKPVTFLDDYVSNYKQGGTWYAETWDASLLFTIRKYYCKTWANPMRADYVSWNGYSTWYIQEFDISKQFNTTESIKHLDVYIDDIFEYFNFHITPISKKKNKFIDFGNLYYTEQDYFNLKVIECRQGVEGYRKISYHSDACFSINFNKSVGRDKALEIVTLLRDLFQILTNEKVGINKIIIGITKKRETDRRKNWFTHQSFYSNIEKPSRSFSELKTEYTKIEKNFRAILRNYFLNKKLQNLIRTFLITVQTDMPISTTLVTLSSGIETYLNDYKFENGSKVKNFRSKLKIVVEKIKCFSNKNDEDVFLDTIKNSRNYFIHGNKVASFVSEAELLPYNYKFSSIYFKFIVNELLNTN